jgi:WD40 repeat protein
MLLKKFGNAVARDVGDNVLYRNLSNIAHHAPEEDFGLGIPWLSDLCGVSLAVIPCALIMVCQPMPPSDPCRVFTSYASSHGAANRKLFLAYAWKDDQRFVKRLYRDLKRHGYDPWMDVQNMPSRGRTLPQEVMDNLSACERVIAIIGPHWLASPACQAEREYAVSIGKVINPILRAGQYEELPTELTKLFVLDFRKSRRYEDALEELLRVIAEPAAPPGALLGVPALPSNYQARPEDLQAVRDAMEIKDLKPVAILSAKHNVALQGMSGIGKTVLAIAYAHDYEARRSFADGIVWLTVRREPNLISLIHLASSALHANLDQSTEVEEAKAQLQSALQDKACLLVLDDVWDLRHAQAFFDVLGPRCRLLLTTRDGGLATKLDAHVWHVDRLKNETARSLLAQSAGVAVESLPPEAGDVAQECGNLPFPLAQCGAVIRNGNSWRDLLDALRKADISYFAECLPNYEYPDVFKSIQVSVDFLARRDPAAAKRYLELGVFPAKQIPEAAAVTLWTRNGDTTEPHARKVLTTLHNVALIERLEGESPERLFSLHDLQIDYVRAVAGDVRELHEDLLQAYQKKCMNGWATGPNDGYFFQYLPYHLKEAQRDEELRSLLFNPRWLQAKLAATDVTALTADFDRLPEDEALSLLQGAIQLSARVIGKDPEQFSSQMVGRLLTYEDMHAIERFVDRVVEAAGTRWLRPLQPALYPPGAALVRILEGHEGAVTAVAVTPDGKLAVSASVDETLKVWDLASGRELRTLAGHTDQVWAVAVTPDGQRAVSASRDQTLKVWDLASGRELSTLGGHKGLVAAVGVTPDGQRAVSASHDGTLKVWALASGRELRTLVGHTGLVTAVAVMPDGQRAVSASNDGTLKVWDLGGGRELRTLRGYGGALTAVAVTPDGQQAVSASSDRMLKVWELESGHELRTLTGHLSAVTAVALTPDGRRAVTVSEDRTLKMWDLASGRELRTLTGHTGYVKAVAVTPDGQCAVSASDDQTLKVWELGSGRELRTLTGHSDWVTALAVTSDGQRAVSASRDQTLKVWELASGRELRTLTGHEGGVTSVGLSGDGRMAVSASYDNTLKVWELATGRELSTLADHKGLFTDVAVTPDGQRVVSGCWGEKTLKVWEVGSGRELRSLTGHSDGVGGVAVTPDGQRAVSASSDHTLKVWELGSGREVRSLTGHSDGVGGVAVTPDGQRAVSASWDKTLKVWDLGSGRELRTLTGHSDGVGGVAVTPDGQWAVSASRDFTVKLWDLETGKVLATFTCDAAANCCAFSDALNLIVAGDALGRVHFLRLEEPKPKS